MLIDDGGEHPVEKCEVKTKIPSKLKKQKLLSDVKSYLGTQQTEFANKNGAGIDMYNHYFLDEADFMATLKKNLITSKRLRPRSFKLL